MGILDQLVSFTPYASGSSIVGAAGTYLAPGSIDLSPLGAYLTENSQGDTQISGGGNARDIGGGGTLKVVINWITAPAGGTSVDAQIITSASPALTSPVVMYEFGAAPIANLTGPVSYGMNVRQNAALPRSPYWLQWMGLQIVTVGAMTAGAFLAWITLDTESVILGGASGYTMK